MSLGNEKYVKKLTSMFEEVFNASKYDKSVARSYQKYLLILVCYGGHGTLEDARFVAQRSLTHRCRSDEAALAAMLLSLACTTLRLENVEVFASLCLAYSNIAREGTVVCIIAQHAFLGLSFFCS